MTGRRSVFVNFGRDFFVTFVFWRFSNLHRVESPPLVELSVTIQIENEGCNNCFRGKKNSCWNKLTKDETPVCVFLQGLYWLKCLDGD